MADPQIVRVQLSKSHRIVRSRFPPIDLFEDIADPADWDAILSAETKTNPRIAKSVGLLDLVPENRRVAGVGASWAMAPFVHISTDRPSRFTDGSFGVYYAGDCINVALFETIHHHEKFMAATAESAGWTSDFRELVGSLDADLHDILDITSFPRYYDPEDYGAAQSYAKKIRASDANGILYRSVRYPDAKAVALFWPDIAGAPIQGQHYAYYWDGTRVSRVKNLTTNDVFSVRE